MLKWSKLGAFPLSAHPEGKNSIFIGVVNLWGAVVCIFNIEELRTTKMVIIIFEATTQCTPLAKPLNYKTYYSTIVYTYGGP